MSILTMVLQTCGSILHLMDMWGDQPYPWLFLMVFGMWWNSKFGMSIDIITEQSHRLYPHHRTAHVKSPSYCNCMWWMHKPVWCRDMDITSMGEHQTHWSGCTWWLTRFSYCISFPYFWTINFVIYDMYLPPM